MLKKNDHLPVKACVVDRRGVYEAATSDDPVVLAKVRELEARGYAGDPIEGRRFVSRPLGRVACQGVCIGAFPEDGTGPEAIGHLYGVHRAAGQGHTSFQ